MKISTRISDLNSNHPHRGGKKTNRQRLSWKKVFEITRNVGSVLSFVMTLIKILQELGVL